MLVSEARGLARGWVDEEASQLPGFIGAFLSGSTKWRSPELDHPASSDVDVRVVIDGRAGATSDTTWAKALYRGILVEASAVSLADLGSASRLASDLHAGGNLWQPVLIADPDGRLASLAERVTALFPQQRYVEQRTQAALTLVRHWLEHLEEAKSFPDHVTAWLFGTTVTTHVLLTAGLRNLTVRRRYVASRELLAQHGRIDLHEEMLGWMGCAEMDAKTVDRHLGALGNALDDVAHHVDPTFRFAADLRPDARSIAIDGSRELMNEGLHREAVFWLCATFSRCLQGLAADAPEALRARCDTGFRELLQDLGIDCSLDRRAFAELRARAGVVLDALPRLLSVARDIQRGTPEIRV